MADDPVARIEAALYSAGRPLRLEEIIRASGTESRAKTVEMLERIAKKTRSAFRALEVATLPDGTYVFQLKPEYTDVARRYASRPVISRATGKTLSYIAYNQPVSTRQLVETRGTGVYAHLKELRQLDFVRAERVGRLGIYTTSEKFQKYFGIQGDADTLREKLFKRVRKVSESVGAPDPIN